MSKPSPASGSAATAPQRDLLDALHALGRFRVFLRLAAAVELVEDLTAEAPLTLFAPTDAAFERLAEGAEALLDPTRQEELIDALEYHLVRGRVAIESALEVGALRSLHGAELHLRGEPGDVFVDGARLVGAPVACRNGVIFVIDAVLSPADPDPWAPPEPHARQAETRLDARTALLRLPSLVPATGARYEGIASLLPR